MSRNLIEVVLISFPSNDIYDFMEWCFWVLFLVIREVVTQDAIIRNFLEGNLRKPDTLLCNLLIKVSLSLL